MINTLRKIILKIFKKIIGKRLFYKILGKNVTTVQQKDFWNGGKILKNLIN